MPRIMSQAAGRSCRGVTPHEQDCRAAVHRPGDRTLNQGFTLIELMIVVAIVALLAVIAYPSYRDQVIRANRTEARTLLLDAAARQERFFSNNNSYATTLADLRFTPAGDGSVRSESDLYALTLQAPNPNDPGGAGAGAGGRVNSFLLTATPLPDRGQTGDTACAAFTLDNRGIRFATGTADPGDCWGR